MLDFTEGAAAASELERRIEGLQMVLGTFDSETVLIETQLTQLINQNCSDDSFEIEVRHSWLELQAGLE